MDGDLRSCCCCDVHCLYSIQLMHRSEHSEYILDARSHHTHQHCAVSVRLHILGTRNGDDPPGHAESTVLCCQQLVVHACDKPRRHKNTGTAFWKKRLACNMRSDTHAQAVVRTQWGETHTNYSMPCQIKRYCPAHTYNTSTFLFSVEICHTREKINRLERLLETFYLYTIRLCRLM